MQVIRLDEEIPATGTRPTARPPASPRPAVGIPQHNTTVLLLNIVTFEICEILRSGTPSPSPDRMLRTGLRLHRWLEGRAGPVRRPV